VPTISTEKRDGVDAEGTSAGRAFYREYKPQGLQIELDNSVCHTDLVHDEELLSRRYVRGTVLREDAGAVKVVAL
jgi:hypothetical protein